MDFLPWEHGEGMDDPDLGKTLGFHHRLATKKGLSKTPVMIATSFGSDQLPA